MGSGAKCAEEAGTSRGQHFLVVSVFCIYSCDHRHSESTHRNHREKKRNSQLHLPAFLGNILAPGMGGEAHPSTGVSTLRAAHSNVGAADLGLANVKQPKSRISPKSHANQDKNLPVQSENTQALANCPVRLFSWLDSSLCYAVKIESRDPYMRHSTQRSATRILGE